MLYKLSNGEIFECPETIRIITNDDEIKKKFGWKPYVHTEPPEYDASSQILHHSYEEQENCIVDVYTLEEFTVPEEDMEETGTGTDKATGEETA